MAIKMKKGNVVIAAAVALILAGVLTGLAACQMDSLDLPPAVPYAEIVKGSDGIYKYVLEWKWEPGILYPDAAYEKVSVERLEQAYEKWDMYTRMIDPRPFYDREGTGIAPKEGAGSSRGGGSYAVGKYDGNWKLDNSDPVNDSPIILHRYWSYIEEATGTPVPIDVATWRSAKDSRAAAFKKAAAEIEGMMASIKASPLYTTVRVDPDMGQEGQPLVALYEAMASFISYNPPLENCDQRGGITWDETGGGAYKAPALLPSGETGLLYEYYLGYAPDSTDYVIKTGPFALPGTGP